MIAEAGPILTLEHLDLRQDAFRLRAHMQISGPGVVAVLGPSGSGKSTLLAALAGFLPAASGRVLWNGQDLTHTPPASRPMSILFQDQNLFPHLSAAQNVALGLSPRARPKGADGDKVEAALERVGLAGFADRRPSQLSGGQASRVALARVLLRARPLVLLDEPFAALGPGLKRDMLDLVRGTLENVLVLMVTHDPEDARRIASRTVLVADGEARAPSDTQAILDDPPESLRDYLGAGG